MSEKETGASTVQMMSSNEWSEIEKQSRIALYHTIEDALIRIAKLEYRVEELEWKVLHIMESEE